MSSRKWQGVSPSAVGAVALGKPIAMYEELSSKT